jgi:hypothetical protein
VQFSPANMVFVLLSKFASKILRTAAPPDRPCGRLFPTLLNIILEARKSGKKKIITQIMRLKRSQAFSDVD